MGDRENTSSAALCFLCKYQGSFDLISGSPGHEKMAFNSTIGSSYFLAR
ncbi:hypothetical protein [Mechercharimyces sp. CAU 1602]|nr:hypothetical protein [Mechercharimyces sp. CAU 1602]